MKKKLDRDWFLLLVTVVGLSQLFLGCAGLQAEPKIVKGNSKTVSIAAGPLLFPHSVANTHCDAYGKRAVLVGRQRLDQGEENMTDLYIYDCRDRSSK